MVLVIVSLRRCSSAGISILEEWQYTAGFEMVLVIVSLAVMAVLVWMG